MVNDSIGTFEHRLRRATVTRDADRNIRIIAPLPAAGASKR
jgi:hypothetical protein